VEESENGLLCAVAKQPISVCVYAPEDFHHYSHVSNSIIKGKIHLIF
jgi:hypothetical protein